MSLDKTFNVSEEANLPAVVAPPQDIPPAVDFREDQKDDYLLSRNIYRELIKKGNVAISDINKLAASLDSPRAYEVLANMMKQVADITDKLMELQRKNKDLYDLDNKTKVEETGRITVEKAVFIGTSDEMLTHVKEKIINDTSE